MGEINIGISIFNIDNVIYGYTINPYTINEEVEMRRKKLDVVFDEGVVTYADKIVQQIEESEKMQNDCTVNRSEVLRCAMEIGLSRLQDKVDELISKGLSPRGLVKVSNLKAMLRK